MEAILENQSTPIVKFPDEHQHWFFDALIKFGTHLPQYLFLPQYLLGTFVDLVTAVLFVSISLFTIVLVINIRNGNIYLRRKLQQSVWTIHGKTYDLSSWVDQHPGGSWAINLGRNRDCTGLFESYHAFADRTRLLNTLKRFEISGCASNDDEEGDEGLEVTEKMSRAANSVEQDNLTGLTFNDEFHEDVRAMVKEYFKDGKNHYMKWWWACMCLIVFALEVFVTYLYWTGEYTFPYFALPFLNWLLTCNVAHDGSHFAVSSRPWINRLCSYTSAPLFFYPTSWNVQHVVQHHVYTNCEDDVDLYHFLPLFRTCRLSRWTEQLKLQWLLWLLVLPTSTGHLLLVVPSDLLTGVVDHATGMQRYEQCQNLCDFVARNRGKLIFEVVCFVGWMVVNCWYWGFWQGVRKISYLLSITSLIFLAVTQGAHVREECFDSDETSWAKRQVAAAYNVNPSSSILLFLTGGLNIQALHHVVPEVGSSHLKDLYPKFQEVCTRHNVELKTDDSFVSFVCGYLNWIITLSSPGPHEIVDTDPSANVESEPKKSKIPPTDFQKISTPLAASIVFGLATPLATGVVFGLAATLMTGTSVPGLMQDFVGLFG